MILTLDLCTRTSWRAFCIDYGWDGTNSTCSSFCFFYILVYLYACLLSVYFQHRLPDLWIAHLPVYYTYIYITVYTIICVSLIYTSLLPSVIYVSAIFHAARWRVHKNRALRCCVYDTARDWRNVNFCKCHVLHDEPFARSRNRVNPFNKHKKQYPRTKRFERNLFYTKRRNIFIYHIVYKSASRLIISDERNGFGIRIPESCALKKKKTEHLSVATACLQSN